MGVRFVTAQSTRHMHYIMTCLSGDCVVLVTITVTTNLCTKETLCSPGVGCVRASLDYGARDTLDCTLVINTGCALRMTGVEWVSNGYRNVTAPSTRHVHYTMTCLSSVRSVSGRYQVGVRSVPELCRMGSAALGRGG